MRESTPLQQDYVFEKLRFRHNEKLANWIFEEMQGGKLIYPHEGLTKAQFVIDKIRDLNEFSEEALRYAVYRSHYYRLVDIDKARKDLQNFSVGGNFIKIIDGHTWKISSGRRHMIDQEYADFSLERIYGARILTKKNKGVIGMFAPWMLMTSEDEPGIVDFEPLRSQYEVDSVISRSGISLLNMFITQKVPDFY